MCDYLITLVKSMYYPFVSSSDEQVKDINISSSDEQVKDINTFITSQEYINSVDSWEDLKFCLSVECQFPSSFYEFLIEFLSFDQSFSDIIDQIKKYNQINDENNRKRVGCLLEKHEQQIIESIQKRRQIELDENRPVLANGDFHPKLKKFFKENKVDWYIEYTKEGNNKLFVVNLNQLNVPPEFKDVLYEGKHQQMISENLSIS